jgi:cysteine desulfurase
MTSHTAYLDWNATAPLRPEAAAAIGEALAQTGNPSSVHSHGRAARAIVERARAQVAAFQGAAPAEIVFTSGGSEANSLALRGAGARAVLVSAIEHDSVRQAVPKAGILEVSPDGIVDLDALDRRLAVTPGPALVSLMLANNETGVIQPVADAAAIAHRHGALLHCDAVQGAGKLALDGTSLGADLLTISAHKLGGPAGIGALVVAPHVLMAALQAGGGQERGRRAGTENLSGIAGFGAACAAAAGGGDAWPRVAALRGEAERRLLAIAPEAPVYGAAAARLPNTLCIGMPGVAAATQVMALDLAGVMVSAGAACSSGKVRRSHVLDAMGVAAADAECAIRISLGWSTTAAEIDLLVDAWGALYARTRASAA